MLYSVDVCCGNNAFFRSVCLCDNILACKWQWEKNLRVTPPNVSFRLPSHSKGYGIRKAGCNLTLVKKSSMLVSEDKLLKCSKSREFRGQKCKYSHVEKDLLDFTIQNRKFDFTVTIELIQLQASKITSTSIYIVSWKLPPMNVKAVFWSW